MELLIYAVHQNNGHTNIFTSRPRWPPPKKNWIQKIRMVKQQKGTPSTQILQGENERMRWEDAIKTTTKKKQTSKDLIPMSPMQDYGEKEKNARKDRHSNVVPSKWWRILRAMMFDSNDHNSFVTLYTPSIKKKPKKQKTGRSVSLSYRAYHFTCSHTRTVKEQY